MTTSDWCFCIVILSESEISQNILSLVILRFETEVSLKGFSKTAFSKNTKPKKRDISLTLNMKKIYSEISI